MGRHRSILEHLVGDCVAHYGVVSTVLADARRWARPEVARPRFQPATTLNDWSQDFSSKALAWAAHNGCRLLKAWKTARDTDPSFALPLVRAGPNDGWICCHSMKYTVFLRRCAIRTLPSGTLEYEFTTPPEFSNSMRFFAALHARYISGSCPAIALLATDVHMCAHGTHVGCALEDAPERRPAKATRNTDQRCIEDGERVDAVSHALAEARGEEGPGGADGPDEEDVIAEEVAEHDHLLSGLVSKDAETLESRGQASATLTTSGPGVDLDHDDEYAHIVKHFEPRRGGDEADAAVDDAVDYDAALSLWCDAVNVAQDVLLNMIEAQRGLSISNQLCKLTPRRSLSKQHTKRMRACGRVHSPANPCYCQATRPLLPSAVWR